MFFSQGGTGVPCPPFSVVALLPLSSCPVLVCCEEFIFWNGVSEGFFLFVSVGGGGRGCLPDVLTERG